MTSTRIDAHPGQKETTTMVNATVTDTHGADLHVGDMVDGPCGYSFRVTDVQPGQVGLVQIRPHGLVLCDHIHAGLNDLVEGSWMTRWADAGPVWQHRDGLVAFGS